MTKRMESSHAIGGVFVFALIGVFAILSLLLVLIGTQAYRAVVRASDANADARSAVNYILNAARASDKNGGATVRDGALVLPGADGDGYDVYIYLYDGWLTEQMADAGDAFSPESGEPLVAATSLSLAEERGLVRVEIGLASGDTATFRIARRSYGRGE